MQSSMLHSSFQIVSFSSFSSVSSIIARSSDGRSYVRFPAPRPVLVHLKDAGSVSLVRIAATMAAPVGVTSSPWIPVGTRVRPCACTIFKTAGTGTGIMPCWHLTKPLPSLRPVTMTSSGARLSSRQRQPQYQRWNRQLPPHGNAPDQAERHGLLLPLRQESGKSAPPALLLPVSDRRCG